MELCGGEGRISTVAFKRRLTSGGNLDLVTGCDLGDPKMQAAINHYLRTCHVMVVILQPNCRSTGRNSHYNAVMNRETWLRHHEEDLPHIQYCGRVALLQMELKRYWMREQPVGTWIDEISPWPQVHAHEEVIAHNMDQCMAGARDKFGKPVKKPTEWTANSPMLLQPLQKFKCNHRPEDHGHPTGSDLEVFKVYPWRLCEAVIDGVEKLKYSTRRTEGWLTEVMSSYPTASTNTDPDLPEDEPRRGSTVKDEPWQCQACQGIKQPRPYIRDWKMPICKPESGSIPERTPGHIIHTP